MNVLVCDLGFSSAKWIGFTSVIFTLISPQRKQIIHSKSLNRRRVYQMATSHLLPRIMNLAQSETLTPVEIALLIEKGYVQCGFAHGWGSGLNNQQTWTYRPSGGLFNPVNSCDSRLQPGQPRTGIFGSLPSNSAKPNSKSIIASLTHSSTPQYGQR